MEKNLNPIRTVAEDLPKAVPPKGPEPTEGACMVVGDCTLPLVFGVVIENEPYTLCDEWGK